MYSIRVGKGGTWGIGGGGSRKLCDMYKLLDGFAAVFLLIMFFTLSFGIGTLGLRLIYCMPIMTYSFAT